VAPIISTVHVAIAACSPSPSHEATAGALGSRRAAAAPSPGSSIAATVVRVVDGDTIRARVAGRVERVRLIGIDTPETVKPNTPVQCFGPQASAHTKALLPPGAPVHLVADVETRDRYGRLLAYVYRDGDHLFVNLALAADGFAYAYTFPPNVAHADEFVAAAARARAANRGLWGGCPLAGPTDRGGATVRRR
jgi:micrococcal nuclease